MAKMKIDRMTYKSVISYYLGKSSGTKIRVQRELAEKYGAKAVCEACIDHFEKTGDKG